MFESTVTRTRIPRKTRRVYQRQLRGRGISQASVARMAAVSNSMVAHWFRGRTDSARLAGLIQQLLGRGEGGTA